jgi:hypothetical protein
MKAITVAAIGLLALCSAAAGAQEDDAAMSEIVVTGAWRGNSRGAVIAAPKPPVIGLRRVADSAVREIEIVSDSRDRALRRREVEAMLLAAIDRAKRDGFSLVTGQFELAEVTRANWQDRFPGLADKADASDDEDEDEDGDGDGDEDDDNRAKPAFEDDGANTRLRMKVKTRLDGSIGTAQQKISGFVKSVPATGRSLIRQTGGLALTIINPEQYRDEIYRRIAAGAKHAAGFYDPGQGLEITGLDQSIAWKQVGNTDVFLYIPYSFSISK